MKMKNYLGKVKYARAHGETQETPTEIVHLCPSRQLSLLVVPENCQQLAKLTLISTIAL